MQLLKFQNDGYIHVKEKEETNQRCVLSKENPQLFSVLLVLVVISQANSWRVLLHSNTESRMYFLVITNC